MSTEVGIYGGREFRAQPPPLRDFRGRNAYITAASDGIGLGIARACADAGMNVIIGYRSPARLERALQFFERGTTRIIPFLHDVTDHDTWLRLRKFVEEELGALHLLVNNAGRKTLVRARDATSKEWNDAVAVNFTAIFEGIRCFVPHMLAHREGAHIVTTASMSGLLPGAKAGVYTATKFATVGLMEALRAELQHTTVGTSVFCPGLVRIRHEPDGRAPPGSAVELRRDPYANGMDPLEAGQHVLAGIRENHLFILTHSEFKEPLRDRFHAILSSFSSAVAPVPRVADESLVLRSELYGAEFRRRNAAPS